MFVPSRVRIVPCPYRTVYVQCPYRTIPFSVFYRERDRFRTVFCPMVRSAKRTEPLIFTVRILVFDREPYRTKMGTVIRLLLRTANRTAIRTAPKLVRYGTDTVTNSDAPLYFFKMEF